jgi:phosphodiesterase/alkaline phosphatase D-like protein
VGDLIELALLDGRQYRSDQACGDATLNLDPPCPEAAEPARTMLGVQQEQWLLDTLSASTAAWNLIGNQVILADSTFNGAVLNYDQWDGYPVARARLLQAFATTTSRTSSWSPATSISPPSPSSAPANAARARRWAWSSSPPRSAPTA